MARDHITGGSEINESYVFYIGQKYPNTVITLSSNFNEDTDIMEFKRFQQNGFTTSCDEHEVRNITEEYISEWIFDPVDSFIITVGVPIILGFGLLTNLLLLFVFLRSPRLRSETDVYLANLALSDVLFLMLFSGYDIWRFAFSQVSKHQPFGSTLGCVTFNFTLNTTLETSIALVTMVTFERYLALCHPIQHLKMRSRRRTYNMVAICWGIGISRCGSIPGAEWMQYISEPLLVIPWCIAMIGNVYMYARIIHVLNKRKDFNADCKNAKTNSKARHVRNQVAKMLVVNGVVFFLCQAPFTLLILTGVDNPISVLLGKYADWIVQSPLRINTVVNPIIYCAFNAQYRAAFTEAFECVRRRGRHSANSLNAVSKPRSNNQSTARSVCSTDTGESKL
ncbi:neuromedin-U receptor 2-like [Asterias amurensis]|uniref:neuromedin-U receptor 2-like n=1 Tax=Asterias amurensis TaxID=7602 RepID=UPI003AB5B2D3